MGKMSEMKWVMDGWSGLVGGGNELAGTSGQEISGGLVGACNRNRKKLDSHQFLEGRNHNITIPPIPFTTPNSHTSHPNTTNFYHVHLGGSGGGSGGGGGRRQIGGGDAGPAVETVCTIVLEE